MGRRLEWRDGIWRVIDAGKKEKKTGLRPAGSMWTEVYDPEEPVHYPFTRWVTFGRHIYRKPGDREDVVFVDPVSGRRKIIVDYDGSIRNFPGIVEEERWMKALISRRYLAPVIRFRTVFEVSAEQEDGERPYRMIWGIQPDGRYWEDEDGFGAEKDLEIRLYADLDKNGDFLGPFRVYNVGSKRMCSR